MINRIPKISHVPSRGKNQRLPWNVGKLSIGNILSVSYTHLGDDDDGALLGGDGLFGLGDVELHLVQLPQQTASITAL